MASKTKRRSVEVRDLATRQFHCQCIDFRINGLGTCQHVEALLGHLAARFKRHFRVAASSGSPRLEVAVDAAANTLRLQPGAGTRRLKGLQEWFDADGLLRQAADGPKAIATSNNSRTGSALIFSAAARVTSKPNCPNAPTETSSFR